MFRLNPALNAVVAPDSSLAPSWTFQTGGGISSSPTVVDGKLFVASNDGKLYALDLVTGRLLWTFTADNMLMTAPLVADGVVVVGEGNYEQIDWQPGHQLLLGSGANSLWGIDEGTGKSFWRLGLLGTGMPTGIIVGDEYVHHDGAGMIVAAGLRDGIFRWRKDVASSAAMTALNTIGPSVLVSAGYEPDEIFAFDLETRSLVWQHLLPALSGGQGDCPPAVDAGLVFGMYLTAPAKAGPLRPNDAAIQHDIALRAQDGSVAWDVVVANGNVPLRNVSAIPIAYDNTVLEGSGIAPVFTALDEHTGAQRWKIATHGTVQGAAVAENGVVYFADADGYLWAVNVADGQVVGMRRLAGSFRVGSPIIAGKSLFIGSDSGRLYAIPLATIGASDNATRAP